MRIAGILVQLLHDHRKLRSQILDLLLQLDDLRLAGRQRDLEPRNLIFRDVGPRLSCQLLSHTDL